MKLYAGNASPKKAVREKNLNFAVYNPKKSFMKTIRNIFMLMLMLSVAMSCSNTRTNNEDSPEDEGDISEIQAEPATEYLSEALVNISTGYGDITVKLYNETPLHRDNFLKLVKDGFYDGLLFHRVIDEFMIQGGDPESRDAPQGTSLGQGGPGYTITAEIKPGLIHRKGALAAARMGDHINPTKASSGSQFYLVQGKVYPLEELNGIEQRHRVVFSQKQKELYSTVGGTPQLDGEYTVFGEVTEGLNVIDAIAALPADPNNRPLKDVKMKMTIIRDLESE